MVKHGVSHGLPMGFFYEGIASADSLHSSGSNICGLSMKLVNATVHKLQSDWSHGSSMGFS